MTAPLIAAFVGRELAAVADPAKAGPMAAYMKTDMPFYGVQMPGHRPIARHLRQQFAPASDGEYRQNVAALWALGHREEKYLAVGYSHGFPAFLRTEHLDLFQRMIVEGAWWDLVDDLAAHNIGPVVLAERAAMRPVLEQWIDHKDLWLRRTALLCQLGHKSATDPGMLFDFCLRRSHETEFFIRKAIGWALREYSRTDPEAVGRFLAAHGDRLSGLSGREASRHL